MTQNLTLVPNTVPLDHNGILIIGEAPGETEVTNGAPFVGPSGRFLRLVLRHVGIDPNRCFYGNICQMRPPDNDITKFQHMGPEFTTGIARLASDVEPLDKLLCILLGNTPLSVFHSSSAKISQWRGSVFHSESPTSPIPGVKCIATYHPAAVLRQYDWAPVFRFDLQRAKRHVDIKGLGKIERTYDTAVDFQSCLEFLWQLQREKPLLSVDIEGGLEGITCIGFATSATHAKVIPILHRNFASIWSPDQECQLWLEIAKVLQDPTIPKVLQNYLYDAFVLAYRMKILVRGLQDDTMLKHWEHYPELDKNLAFQASIYTDQEFYKSDRKSGDYQTYLRYCGTDCAVTYEINSEIDRFLNDPRRVGHYKFNLELLSALLYMELRGFRYDVAKLPAKRAVAHAQLYSAQDQLDLLAGKWCSPDLTPDQKLQLTIPIVVMKKYRSSISMWDQVASYCFKEYEPDMERLTVLGKAEKLTTAECAEFRAILGLGMNIRGKEFKPWFFDKLGMPRMYSADGALTTDNLAMMKLLKKTEHPVCRHVLDISDARTHLQMLSIKTDEDGRIRCGYNVVGTETGRLTCYTSPTGSGYNLQTIPEYDRDLFLADEDYWLFQCDLSGADGWTVACHCAANGDFTMLDDLRAGIKIAKVIACMFTQGPEVSQLSRENLKTLTDMVSKTDPIYFAAKCCQHGTNYGMAENTMADTIFKQSGGQIYQPPKVCGRLRYLYLARYKGVEKWHRATEAKVAQNQVLWMPNGHMHTFMGRPGDHDTLKAALSTEPQNNTSYVTNLALHRLITDPENRSDSGSYRIEPLHQIHDALMGQFRRSDTNWALPKIRAYFNNPITIAGIPITIPFDGAYGESWGSLPNKI